MGAVALIGTAYAEANWGRWIARCPQPWCTNALRIERGQTAFSCEGLDGCGRTAEIVWPPDPAAVETILLMRPVPRTRNWVPGEQLQDLLAENALHGITPPEWDLQLEPGEQHVIADIVDDRVVGGLLRNRIETSTMRYEIGA